MPSEPTGGNEHLAARLKLINLQSITHEQGDANVNHS